MERLSTASVNLFNVYSSIWNDADISTKATVDATAGFTAAILKSSVGRHGTLSAEVPLCRSTSKTSI